EVVSRLIHREPGALPGLGHPQSNRTVSVISAIVAVPGSDLDCDLERHPLVRLVAYAAHLLIQHLIAAVLTTATVVHLGSPPLIGVLHDDFELCAGIRRLFGAVPLADNGLFPAAAFAVGRVQKLWREALAPLHEEFLALAELRAEIVGEVLPEA